jgi:LacI family transcriptional regulator
MGHLLDLGDPPTAVFVLSDEMALGALHELGRRRLQPGVDLSVVGFDDHQAARVVGLTTMAQPMTGMGRSAVVEVLRRVASPDAEPSGQMVAVSLLVRSSTGPAPHRG